MFFIWIYHQLSADWFCTFHFLAFCRSACGRSYASHTVAAAYIADVSTKENKAQNFGLLGAAFGLGFIIGPVIGGILGHYGPRVPFFAAASLTFLNFLYGYFVVPESLPKEHRRNFRWINANPIGSFRHIKKYPIIMPLVVCIFLINIAAHAVQSTWSYFTMEKFHWNERMVGYSLGVIGILLTIVQAGLIRVIIPKLGLAKSIVTGLFLNCISLFAFGIVDTTLLLFVTSIFYVFAGIAGPAMQSSISNHTPANEQGQIQGGLTSIISLTAIIGPLVMTSLFSFFTKKMARCIYRAHHFISEVF